MTDKHQMPPIEDSFLRSLVIKYTNYSLLYKLLYQRFKENERNRVTLNEISKESKGRLGTDFIFSMLKRLCYAGYIEKTRDAGDERRTYYVMKNSTFLRDDLLKEANKKLQEGIKEEGKK